MRDRVGGGVMSAFVGPLAHEVAQPKPRTPRGGGGGGGTGFQISSSLEASPQPTSHPGFFLLAGGWIPPNSRHKRPLSPSWVSPPPNVATFPPHPAPFPPPPPIPNRDPLAGDGVTLSPLSLRPKRSSAPSWALLVAEPCKAESGTDQGTDRPDRPLCPQTPPALTLTVSLPPANQLYVGPFRQTKGLLSNGGHL